MGWTLAICGLVILAAVGCIILWAFIDWTFDNDIDELFPEETKSIDGEENGEGEK